MKSYQEKFEELLEKVKPYITEYELGYAQGIYFIANNMLINFKPYDESDMPQYEIYETALESAYHQAYDYLMIIAEEHLKNIANIIGYDLDEE